MNLSTNIVEQFIFATGCTSADVAHYFDVSVRQVTRWRTNRSKIPFIVSHLLEIFLSGDFKKIEKDAKLEFPML
jgi:hypothetical protein